jgi:hypothetical protein
MMADSLAMSDEEFLKAPMPTEVSAEQQTQEPVETDDEQSAADTPAAVDTTADDAGTDDAADNGTGDEPTDTEQAASTDDADDGGTPAEAADQGQEDKGAEADPKSDEVADKPETPAVDYKAEYEKLMATFKANGRDFNIKSVDDARSLMQMGANYSKKMAALKPNLKLMKSLENAGLLSEDKISYMIDLMRNAPGAVNKLVKDHNIDPMEVDVEKAGEYQAGNHEVSDTELELDDVMEDLRESPKVQELITLVTKQLDRASKDEIQKQPGLLRTLDSQMNNGIYDVILKEMNEASILGRLSNVPFLQAYQQIGNEIQARGGFDHLFEGSSPKQKETPPVRKVVEPPKSVKSSDEALKEKRRAASSNRPVVSTPSKPAKEFDPLAMSDEEFLKLGL